MTDGIISQDEKALLFRVWVEYVTDKEWEHYYGGEPAIETDPALILTEGEAKLIYHLFHSDDKDFRSWYAKALEIIEGFNLSYYHSEE